MKRDLAKAQEWQRRSKRISPRSARTAAAVPQRRALVRTLLAEHPVCQARVVCHGAPAVDVHERLKRSRGGDPLNAEQSHAVTVCRACHEWTEAEPLAATAARMLLPSWHRCAPGGIGPC